jgi:hypothetical protein
MRKSAKSTPIAAKPPETAARPGIAGVLTTGNERGSNPVTRPAGP